MIASKLRSASLAHDGKETGEVVLILPAKDFIALAEAVEVATKAHPRKGTFKRLLHELEEVSAW